MLPLISMKYLPSALGVGQLSGSAGAVTASHNRYGAYLRAHVIPVNPATAAQTAWRALISNISQGWRSLTDAERNGWNAYALTLPPRTDALSSNYTLNGQTAYVSANTNIKLYDSTAALITTPGGIVQPTNLVSVTPAAAVTGNTFTVAYTATPLAANTKVVIYTSPMMAPGIQYIKPSLLAKIHTSAAAAASPANIRVAYTTKYGALSAGKKVRVRTVVISSTGGRSIADDQIITIGA